MTITWTTLLIFSKPWDTLVQACKIHLICEHLKKKFTAPLT